MNFYQQQVLSIRKAVYPHEDLDGKMVRTKKYIDGHYGSVIDLDAMAREACMSKFHFIRSFKRYYGRTPHAYLKEVRVAEAKRLLQKGVPIRHVCYAVG
ncbi:MAG TPA: AraC family transcriptional regulator, partial [Puia sp.]|nr:AraC family transcriptional regulator [Puia sp.]